MGWAQQGSQVQQTGGPGQMPIQDLTPPSDLEMERAALEAEAERQAAAAVGKSTGDTAAAPSKPTPPTKGEEGYLFKAEVEEVMLYATVVDPRNRMRNDLNRQQFTVYEDGVPQTITSFRRDDIPVSVGIVIDNSGSMRDKRPAVNQAALNFVRASNKNDEVFIVNYDSEYYLDQDFTGDINKLKEGLEQIQARGGTAMFDAVIASADHLSKGGRLDKKVLLVVTDGVDTASVRSIEEAVRAVQKEAGPTIYTIGVLEKEGRERKKAKRALERLALETGGIAYFPENLDEVDQITRAVAHDIRNQYAIGYKPSRPQSEGGFRSVKVEAKAGGQKLQVRTKSGYFAGQKQANAGTSD